MRKVLVSLLVVAMLLGLVGTAFAYTDVTANKYIDQATAFGWLKGYEDGSFKPAGNITRAEAAAVIVRGLGLEAAAEAAKGLASKFTDVPATHWASGYINVCTTKNILKGYPDGTFKPEANITNAEIITMIVRALNRESQAVGEWPVGHITVAASEKIIGTGFASNALATREGVATFVVKAADVPFLKLTTNGWEEDTKTMAEQNELTLVEDLTVTGYDADVEDPTITVTGTGAGTYSMATGYAIEGGKLLREIQGSIVDLYLNDDDDVVFVAVSTATAVKKGDLKSVGSNYFYLYNDSKKYTLQTDALGAITADVYRNGEPVTFSQLAVDDVVEFSMEDNVVVTLRATVFDHTRYVVTSVRSTGDIESQYVKGTQRATTKTFYMTDETKIELDGKTVALSALKEDMSIDVQVDPNQNPTGSNPVAIFVKASSKTVAGKVTNTREKHDGSGDYFYISIDGVEYRVEGYAQFYDEAYVDADGVYSGADDVVEGIDVGDTVTAYLSVRGRIRMLDAVTGSAAFGKIVSKSSGGTYDTLGIDVKGQVVTYEISEDDDDEPSALQLAAWTIGTYVKISKNDDGRLDRDTLVIAFQANPAAVPPVVGFTTTVDMVAPFSTEGEGAIITDINGNDVDVEDDDAGELELDFSDNAVIYLDGVYATLSDLADDYRVKWYIEDSEVVFAIADSFADYEPTVITSSGRIITGLDGAVEAGSRLRVYTTNTDATYDEWTAAPPAAAAEVAASTDSDRDGVAGFTIDLTGGAGSHGNVAAGTEVWVRVIDRLGNWTTFKITVR